MSLSQTAEDLPEWRLSDLFPGAKSPEFLEAKLHAEREAHAFRDAAKGQVVAMSPATLAATVERYDALQDRLGKISSYVSLAFAADASDPEIGKLYGDTSDWLTKIGSELLFFDLELNRIPDEAMARAQLEPKLSRYKPWLDHLRALKPYQLDDELERAFHDRAQTANGAWIRLYDETLTALRYDVGGKELTGEEALHLLSEPERDVRRDAAQALAKTFNANLRLFTHITNTLAKDKDIEDAWRKFPDATTSRHLGNRVEPEVVEALASSVRAAYPRLSHRYYAMKARWLGMDKLAHWDRNAPLPDKPERVIPWAEAQQMVLSAYSGFAPEMSAIAKDFFDKRWIDAPVRPGKSPGAFSASTVPSVHPYVMMNYQGKVRDVMTLAHELGHGVHQVLAARQGPLLAPTPLTLAETASVFGEILVTDRLLAEEKNPAARRDLLAAALDDMYATVLRQAWFTRFERWAHDAVMAGKSTDELSDHYLEDLKVQFGDSVAVPDEFRFEWTAIPHLFQTPFYCYAYSFGQLLVLSLYRRFQEEGERFKPGYLRLLGQGGAARPLDVLAEVGVDPRDRSFWRGGFGVVRELVEELESL